MKSTLIFLLFLFVHSLSLSSRNANLKKKSFVKTQPSSSSDIVVLFGADSGGVNEKIYINDQDPYHFSSYYSTDENGKPLYGFTDCLIGTECNASSITLYCKGPFSTNYQKSNGNGTFFMTTLHFNNLRMKFGWMFGIDANSEDLFVSTDGKGLHTQRMTLPSTYDSIAIYKPSAFDVGDDKWLYVIAYLSNYSEVMFKKPLANLSANWTYVYLPYPLANNIFQLSGGDGYTFRVDANGNFYFKYRVAGIYYDTLYVLMGGQGNPVELTTPSGKAGCSQEFQVTASGKVWAIFTSDGDYISNVYWTSVKNGVWIGSWTQVDYTGGAYPQATLSGLHGIKVTDSEKVYTSFVDGSGNTTPYISVGSDVEAFQIIQVTPALYPTAHFANLLWS